MKRIFNESLITLALIGAGIFVSLVVLAYIYSVAGQVIDDTIYGVSAVIGYGMIALSFVAMACSIAIISAFSGRVVGSQWFSFLIMKAQARKELLQSEFEFEVLEEGQQGFVLSRPGADLVGRNASLEAGPFSSTSLPNDNPVNLAKWQMLNSPKPQAAAGPGDVPMKAEQRQPLLTAIKDCKNILVVGGKGRGKTELMMHLEAQRMSQGHIVTILDSHSQPGKWAGQVIGAGRKYESIARAMIDLTQMLDSRYELFSQGKDDFQAIDCFVDEFTLLPDKLKQIGYDIQDYSKPALTEGRKVGLNLIWGIHSDRASALGLKGAMDLKECFDAVVYLKKIQNDFYAHVNFGEGVDKTVKYAHPGPFISDRPSSKPIILSLPDTSTSEAIAVENWPIVEEPEDRAAVIRKLYSEGLNKTEIAQHFGYKSNSGAIFHDIKKALNGSA